MEILIIEDEIIIAKDIKTILEKYGYGNIQIVTNYDDAMVFLKNSLPDLIICDIYLKGEKTGIDIIENLSKKVKIPVVYVSAYSDDKTLTKAFESKPITFITKPYTENQLLIAVKFAMNESGNSHRFDFSIITNSEREIIKLLSNGMTTREIAYHKNRSYDTINNHKRNIFKKLNIHSIAELVSFAIENGLN